MSDYVIELKQDQFQQFIDQDKAVVEFNAQWCGPCKKLLEVLEKLSKETPTVKFGKADIEENEKICNTFAIKGVPTIIYFEKGKEVKRSTGSLNEQKVKEMYA